MRYRTALVTGASSGLGRALSVALVARGVHVVLAARRFDQLRETAALAARGAPAGRGGSTEILPLDVRDGDATAQAVAAADARLGGLDLVVANAGVGVASREAPSWSWEAIGAAFHTNFCGAAATLTGALPAMVRRGSGHLVGISSLAALGPLPEAAAYCAPKAGLDRLLDCLRLDLHATGVQVTTVRLGFVRTAMTEKSTHPQPQLMDADEAIRRVLRRLPSAPASIDLPQPLALAVRLSAHVPGRDRLLRALAK